MAEHCPVLLALEQAASEVVDEFEDEAVIPEPLHSLLARTRRGLEELRAQAPTFVGLIECREHPDEATVERLRAGLGREENLYL